MTHGALLNLALVLAPGVTLADSMPAAIEQAMFGSHRTQENQNRNRYRHPVGTLTFFGLRAGMRVIEISPGGGWYSEILAPVLRDQGTFVAAIFDEEVPDQPAYRYRLNRELSAKFAADPDVYDQVELQPFSPPQTARLGEPGSADMVLTFRNAHGWINDGYADVAFDAMFNVLKPGGVLGIVQHRAEPGADVAESARSGYVPEQGIIDLAIAAGFELEARSEVNANPADSRDHPEGVWTLPPSLRLDGIDRDMYLAIGESDRMTLRFRKPE